MPSLTVITGPDRGKRFELGEDGSTIGRDVRNEIRLHDNEASRQHARLQRDASGISLVDLGSSNGTFVNGGPVTETALRTGDRIRIGQTEMIYHAGGQAGSGELADRINMIPAQHQPEASAILRAIKPDEGTEFLRHPERAGSQWLQNALANLAVMYETSQAISKISDLDELLDHIMDLAFKTIKPDRSCIVLKDVETGALKPTAARYSDTIGSEDSITLSKTIIESVLNSGEGVIVMDATQDQRFADSKSVVKIGIREAICVPLRGRHDTLGVMYVDTKADRKEILRTQQPTKFTDDHLRLMIAIAHQAGLAIEDTRFYQAMMQAERLAAIGQAIASLSHHIKNILQGLRSGSYLLEMGLNEKKHEFLQQGWSIVQKNQDKIYNLVMDMLSISKDREPAWEIGSLSSVVADVVELMESRAREFGVSLETKFAPDMPDIAFDAEGIHRMVLNILTNAIDAVEGVENARIMLETTFDLNEEFAFINIVDNGCGIPPDQLQRIFQIFASTKGSRGSGLGLAVSEKIAREHGGHISVVSKINKGSRFTIHIPLRVTLPRAGDSGVNYSDFREVLEEPSDSGSDTRPQLMP